MDTSLKTCFKCHQEKPLSEFYKHSGMTDGHLNKCKECAKQDTKKQRAANHEYYIQYDRQRAKLPHRIEANKERFKQYRKSHPDREKARSLLYKEYKQGKIAKLPCFVCGSLNTEAHHPDYSRPLDVIWLCAQHHKQAHAVAYYSLLNAA